MRPVQTTSGLPAAKFRRKANDALNLERFMARAGPVMELVIEESEQMHQLDAAKRPATELK